MAYSDHRTAVHAGHIPAGVIRARRSADEVVNLKRILELLAAFSSHSVQRSEIAGRPPGGCSPSKCSCRGPASSVATASRRSPAARPCSILVSEAQQAFLDDDVSETEIGYRLTSARTCERLQLVGLESGHCVSTCVGLAFVIKGVFKLAVSELVAGRRW